MSHLCTVEKDESCVCVCVMTCKVFHCEVQYDVLQTYQCFFEAFTLIFFFFNCIINYRLKLEEGFSGVGFSLSIFL